MIHKLKKLAASDSVHVKGIVYGILSGVSVTGYVLVNRFVYNQYGVDPYTYAVTFAAAGGLFALAALLVRHGKERKLDIPHKTVPQLFVVGAAGGLAMVLVAIGLNYTSAVNAGVIFTASIIATSLFSVWLLKERFTGNQWLWLAVMFIGLYLGVVGLHLISFQAGDLIILTAMGILGFNNTFSKIVMRTLGGSLVADARLTISALLALAVGFGIWGTDTIVTSAGLWPLLAGFFLWACIRTFYLCIQYASPNQAIVLNNGQIFFTALGGVVLLSEPYDWIKFLGSVLVLVSIYFISKRQAAG